MLRPLKSESQSLYTWELMGLAMSPSARRSHLSTTGGSADVVTRTSICVATTHTCVFVGVHTFKNGSKMSL